MPGVKPKARLFVPEPLVAGESLSLSADSAHYVTTVMRVAAGESVLVFNGADGEWRAQVIESGRRACRLAIDTQTRPQRPEPGPWLLFAPVKKAAVDSLVEKATELGAERLWPVITQRTTAARINLRRLRAHAIEAAEQCERLTVPEVAEPSPLRRLAKSWPADRPLLVADVEGRGPPLAEVLTERPRPAHGLLIGPEGGLTPSELDALLDLPFATAVGLGPRILRAETAALAALSCWQAIVGDGAMPPRS